MRYIGSKTKVLDFIVETIQKTGVEISKDTIIADLFSGTVCVAERFKELGAKVITNDYLHFSYALQIAKIKYNICPEDYNERIKYLNELEHKTGGFFAENYTAECKNERNYFSHENAVKIDAICQQLKAWLNSGEISNDMYWLLCASLVDAITKVSNVSGTYGSFLKINDPRKYKSIQLEETEFIDNGQINECYCKDIFDLIDEVSGDILYLDPPYNSRQYAPYYHILETAVLYDKPAIYGKTGRRPYQDKLSPFCKKEDALDALIDIVKRAKFENIYISYSTDGIISVDSMKEALEGLCGKEINSYQIFYKPYKRYKSNSGVSEFVANNIKLKEMIVYVRK